MRMLCAATGAALAVALPAAAEDPPLMCFGSEPSWSLALEPPGAGRLSLPDEPAVDYRGASTRLDPLGERVWRGEPAGGGGSLVAFLRDGACSDGMSDTTHPVAARVSLPDGRFFAGCCRFLGSSAIEGSVWRLVQLGEPGESGGQGEPDLAALPSPVAIRFESGRVQGFGGCNRIAGSYSVEGDRLELGPLAGTMMACPPPEMAVETAFREAFTGPLRFRVAEGRLTLASPSESDPRLVFEAAPPPRLEGVIWQVTGFNNGRQAVVSPIVGTALTVSFEEGAVVGYAGCNSFRAAYSREGDRLSVGPAAATRRACLGEGVMEQEQAFLAAIQTATTWTVDDRGMLDVHRADGERVLTASPGAQ